MRNEDNRRKEVTAYFLMVGILAVFIILMIALPIAKYVGAF